MRIVTNDGRAIPVAFEPRSDTDQLPWVEYEPEHGTRRARYHAAECTTIPTALGDHDPSHRFDRSILARLEQAGIHSTLIHDRGSYYQITFADGCSIHWGADDCYGTEASVTHPIAEHSELSAWWTTEDLDAEDSATFASGSFETDSAALVTWITAKADACGRIPPPALSTA